MHRLVEELATVLQPPSDGGDTIDWEQVRLEYGVTFPGDYRSFVEVYGGGFIDDYLDILTPPVEGSVYGQLLSLAPLAPGRRHPDGYPLYPDSGGILRWAATASGDDVFWHCLSDDPDEWATLVCTRQIAHGEKRWKSFDVGMVGFLLLFIRDGHPSPLSEPDIPSQNSMFTSWRDED